jgi:hypothetical protein
VICKDGIASTVGSRSKAKGSTVLVAALLRWDVNFYASVAGYLVLRSQPQGYLALGAQLPYTHTAETKYPGQSTREPTSTSTGGRHGCRDQHRRPLPRKLLFLVAYIETQDKETDNNILPMPAGSVQTSCFLVPYTPFSQD